MAALRHFLTALAVLLVLHAGFSVAFERHKLAGGETLEQVPIDIVVECLAGLALFLTIIVDGEVSGFSPIIGKNPYSSKTLDTINARLEFQSFNHRGRAMRDALH